MLPVDVFLEEEWLMPEQPPAEEWEMAQQPLAVIEDWEVELLVPAQGRLVYVCQGQFHFAHFHESNPGLLYPKRKKRKRGK
jgi:hypothetical protein